MLERHVIFMPDDITQQPIERIIQGTEPYLDEIPGYEFRHYFSLIKAPNNELANKFWTLPQIQKIEFVVQVTRMLDRMFVNEGLPFRCDFVRVNLGFTENYSPRQFTFQQTMDNIRARGLDDYYIEISNHAYVIEIFNINENPPTTEPDDDGEEPDFRNIKEDKIIFISEIHAGNQTISRDEANIIYPKVDFATMKLLYLRFDLPAEARDMLSLTLSNTFTYQTRTPGRISRGRLEALENNDYNRYNAEANRAVSALAITGAHYFNNQRYFSGYNDPRQVLRRLENQHAELRE